MPTPSRSPAVAPRARAARAADRSSVAVARAPGRPPDAPQIARAPGRPRSEHLDRAIRSAALALLVRDGFSDLTVEAIAAKAKVGKATVYRRWPCKSDLIVDAFFETVSPRVRIHDTGSLRADLRAQMRLVVREMIGPHGKVLATLLACMQLDTHLAEVFRTRWLALRRAEGRAAIERGIERGELPHGVEPDFVLDALYSPLYFRLLVGHQKLSVELVDAQVDLVFDGLGNAAAGGRRRRSARRSRGAR